MWPVPLLECVRSGRPHDNDGNRKAPRTERGEPRQRRQPGGAGCRILWFGFEDRHQRHAQRAENGDRARQHSGEKDDSEGSDERIQLETLLAQFALYGDREE